MAKELFKPDYLFEVSWEVCNKMGGIYTVVATKAYSLSPELGRHHIMIGPDFWTSQANPDFTEDKSLYPAWKEQVALEGLKVRLGRWEIPGRPIAILIDFMPLMASQYSILGELWNKFGVESLTGRQDYKESAVFGFAAGKAIESFRKFNLDPAARIVAQFHEWQTGSGVLYLKSRKVPVGTVFTTHATMIGRCLCGNNWSLYKYLESYDADSLSQNFNVAARHSLEKKSAQYCDVFTTVSDITARECKQFHGRPVDIVTPNGFDDSFVPATEDEFAIKRAQARGSLIEVAEQMSGAEVDKDAIFVGIGGRYEWRNKGIDVFIDALASLKDHGYSGKQIHAFIMIPSGHKGPQPSLYRHQTSHVLTSAEWDNIVRKLNEAGINNAEGDKVKAYYIPSYLNGNDGVFNKKYYDLLIGMDLSVFPSYYEPWGYTPLESLAFGVPTLTTTLAGFGVWVKDHLGDNIPGITVVKRDDENYENVVEACAARMREIACLTDVERKMFADSAREVSRIALWQNLIQYYHQAYSEALEKAVVYYRSEETDRKQTIMQYSKIDVDTPSWKSVMVTRHLPKEIAGLERLCKNLWWCWNDSAKALFKSIDPQMWHDSGHNPMYLLDKVSLKKYEALSQDKSFVAALNAVMDEFDSYMAEKEKRTDPSVAYFCMEYGLDTSLKIYSGGLGILAGDYLKETSDMNVNLVAVGFLYRYGYFTQQISAQGNQIAQYEPQDFLRIPAQPVFDAEGKWLTVSVDFPGRTLNARIWKVGVGRTDLYLLDTDYEANLPEDRSVTHSLYGGDWENRLKQEILLGFGGIRTLRALGLNPQIYHCNEGHAAFTSVERLAEYVQSGELTFTQAMEVVRASSLFTTHTPVPAGHDAFEEWILRKYLGQVPETLGIDWASFLSLGKINVEDPNEKYSMSVLAANCAQNVNGVSMLHGLVSQDIFAPMYKGYLPEELHVSYVTNGVHYPTWAAKEWKAVHAEVFGEEFKTHHYDLKCFEGIYNVSDEKVWDVRKVLKKDLIDTVKAKISDPQLGSHYSPSQIVKIKERLSDKVLTIGFARRFATYKRATLLFSDLDRLDAIVNNPYQPVQFLFAGKAHPADKAGQDLIRQIIEISKQDRFLGKIVFVPGYDITVAKRLVQGVDVWLNNPTRPQEASGTSGEKASMNGVMHFSVLDGWWVEGYKPGCGWALPLESTYDDNNYQNELDAATIYATIESEIAPAYYNIDRNTGRSAEWIGYIKNTIAQVACNFTTNRMLTDYCNQYYIPQGERTASICADDYAKAKELAAWKERVTREWKNLSVVSYTQPDSSYVLSAENLLKSEVVLNLGELSPEDIGVELIFTTYDKKGKLHIAEKFDFQCTECNDGVAKFAVSAIPERTGMYNIGTRVYPKHSLMPHRQDLPLVKWL